MLPKPEAEILIACSRLELDDMHRDRASLACAGGNVDWELVYSAAVAHKIAPLVYKNLQDCGLVNDFLPPAVVDKFQNLVRWNAVKNAIGRGGIAELPAFFDRRSHDVLLLKHAAFSVRLRELFDLTMSDDVDIVIRPKGESVDGFDQRYFWKIRPWMFADRLQNAFRWFTYDDTDHTSAVIREFSALERTSRRHFSLELENRHHHDILWGGVISIDFRRVWENANRKQVEGRGVYVPDDHDLIIMNSINIHRKPWLRLRNLVEIHELMRHGEFLDWEGFARKVRAYRCSSLVYSALHTTRAVLGSDIPESILKSLRPGFIRARTITLINRSISPSTICGPRNLGGCTADQHRSIMDLARRFVALSGRQLMRYIFIRIILHGVLGILKW
jgi:hypothetical protein